MGEIKVYAVDKDQAENAAGLMLPQPAEALRKGLPFFRSMGFAEDALIHPMYYVGYVEDLKDRDKMPGKISEKKGDILPFSQVGDKMLKAASHISAKEGHPMPEGGILSDNVDRDLSFCAVRDGKIQAYVTVEETEEDMIEISSLWSGLDNPMELLAMLMDLIEALKKSYPPETRIVMLSTDERVDKLIDYLFRYAEPRSFRMAKISNG